jgi:hypothetical protein
MPFYSSRHPRSSRGRKFFRVPTWFAFFIGLAWISITIPAVGQSFPEPNDSAAAKPKTWQTQVVKDELTDETRLRARAEAASDNTKYQFNFTCDAKGEHLTIFTFQQDDSGKRILFGKFRIRADAGPILDMNLKPNDYYNSGSVDIISDILSISSINKLVIADIFQGEQIALAVDFSRGFRDQCRNLTQPVRDAAHSARLKSRQEYILSMIAATTEAVYAIYGYNGPFTGLSSDALRRFDWNKISSPAYSDRIHREFRFYGKNAADEGGDIFWALQGPHLDGLDRDIVVRGVPVNGVADSGFAVAFDNTPSELCVLTIPTALSQFQQLFQSAAKRAIVDGNGSIDGVQPKRGITQQDAAAMCGTNAMTTVEWIFAH